MSDDVKRPSLTL